MNDAYRRPAHCSEAEWAARVELAAAYRMVHRMGWSELIYNHLSLRVPGADGQFLINPFGLHYSEVRASNLVKVDVHGQVIGASEWPVNPAGFTFHGAIHEALPDVHCVMHVHTTATMAVCCLDEGLSYTNFYAAILWGQVAYHDFEGITVRADEGARIVASAAGKPVLLLRNHGPVVMGRTVAEAFSRLWTLQRACEVQMATAAMGRARPIPVPVLEACVRDALNVSRGADSGQDVFAAMRRLVDREDPTYRA